MEVKITMDELETALKQMKCNKVPGLGGLTVEFTVFLSQTETFAFECY